LTVTVITASLPERAGLLAELAATIDIQTVPVEWRVEVDYLREGPVTVFNRLASQVTTEWLFPIGDDDLFDPHHFATLDPFLHDGYDIVYTWCRITGSSERPENQFQVCLQDTFGWKHLRKENWIPAAAAIRTSLWEKLGGYRQPDWTVHEDHDLWVRALDADARFCCIPRVTYTYRADSAWSHRSEI
jgi:hypothetical protein